MTFPVYTVDDLSEFSGRPVSEYPTPYTDSSLAMSTLLYHYATCTDSLPGDNSYGDQLAKLGILSMADHMILGQPYQQALASPFNSESIGSYSYSKTYARSSSAATAVSKGEQTGIQFFDLAVGQFGVCDINQGVPQGGGIEVFEHDGHFIGGKVPGNKWFVSPSMIDTLIRDPYAIGASLFTPSTVIEVDLEQDPDNSGLYIP